MKRQLAFQFLIAVLLLAKPVFAVWYVETVDSTGNVGAFTSIAIDANDNPHISYGSYANADLKYAYSGPCKYVLAGDTDDDC